MFLALFTDPARNVDIHDTKHTLFFSGQAKRKTFDKTMTNAKTTLYVFERTKVGWTFLGNARVCSEVQPRTDEHPPVWELELIITSNDNSAFKSKKEIFDHLGLVPKYKNLALGFIPVY